MEQFTAHQLRFTCEATTELQLSPFNGSSLRGAFFNALLDNFCLNRSAPSCLICPLNSACPISRLAATVDPQSTRGQEVPRPFSIEPVLRPPASYAAGDGFAFGITLFGEAITLFPYVYLAVQAMGQTGIGGRPAERGRFRIKEVQAINPFSGEQQTLTGDGGIVCMPSIPITHQQVEAAAQQLVGERLTLSFLTPTRLIARADLVRWPVFSVVMRRVFRRLTDLCQQNGLEFRRDFPALLEQAETVKLVADRTIWTDLESYSRRQHRYTPMGGFLGTATYEGPFAPLLPYVLWGTVTHIGRDITKGNGWFRAMTAS